MSPAPTSATDQRTPLNCLSAIITSAGDYVTRSGGRVTICRVDPVADETVTRFAAKGARWRMFRGVYQPRGYDIWHVSGRHNALATSPHDIVGRFEPQAEAAD